MNTEEQQELGQDASIGISVGESAVREYYTTLGQGMDRFRSALSNAKTRGIYVYAVNIRWPKVGNPGFFALVKAYTEEGPQIAFHSSYQLNDLLMGIGARMRSGAFEWQPDEFPQDGWEEEMSFMHKQELGRD